MTNYIDDAFIRAYQQDTEPSRETPPRPVAVPPPRSRRQDWYTEGTPPTGDAAAAQPVVSERVADRAAALDLIQQAEAAQRAAAASRQALQTAPASSELARRAEVANRLPVAEVPSAPAAPADAPTQPQLPVHGHHLPIEQFSTFAAEPVLPFPVEMQLEPLLVAPDATDGDQPYVADVISPAFAPEDPARPALRVYRDDEPLEADVPAFTEAAQATVAAPATHEMYAPTAAATAAPAVTPEPQVAEPQVAEPPVAEAPGGAAAAAAGQLADPTGRSAGDSPDTPSADQGEAAHQTEAGEAGESPRMSPAWEVDQFPWPAATDRLLERCGQALSQSLDRICGGEPRDLPAGRVLAVTSQVRGEGRSTLAMTLARQAGAMGLRVALVDADFGNPHLAAALRMEVPHSWHTRGPEQLPLEETAVLSLQDRLTLLGLNRDARARGLRTTDPAFASLIEDLRGHFELIVVDAPPVDELEELLARRDHPVDSVLFVRDVRATSRDEAESRVQALRDEGVGPLWIAENFG